MPKANPKISPQAERLITRVLNRADDFAFMGSMHPDEHGPVERGYKRAILDLKRYIERLETRKPTVEEIVKPE